MSSVSLNLEEYLESWKGLGIDSTVLQNMHIQPGVTIDISFCSFNFASSQDGLPGLQFTNNAEAVKTLVDYIHSKGGKVKLSFGGATYPIGPYLQGNGIALAKNIANTIQTYGFDGVDLDIEDGINASSGVVSFFKNLREDLGDTKTISLTVPGQDWAAQSWITACEPYVDCFNFMEYYLWLGSDSLVDRIQSDVDTYINQWKIPPSKIQLGLMPGQSASNNLTLDDAKELAQWAQSKGLAGLMMWDANRDYDRVDGNTSLAYYDALLAILDQKQSIYSF